MKKKLKIFDKYVSPKSLKNLKLSFDKDKINGSLINSDESYQVKDNLAYLVYPENFLLKKVILLIGIVTIIKNMMSIFH